MILVFLATLGAIVVGFVLYPIFGSERAGALGEGAEALALRDLEDKKARLYTAIKDLDFEKAAGKVSDEDYESARVDYVAQAAEVIARIDQLAPKKKTSKPKPEESSSSQDGGARTCPSCGEANRASAKFCTGCGQAFERVCAECGEKLSEKANFCSECGQAVGA